MTKLMSLAEFSEQFGPLDDLPEEKDTFTTGIHLAALLCLARGSTGIIEFGTARGQTTLALARACPDALIVTLDVDAVLVPPGTYQQCDLRPRDEVGAAFRNTPEAERITSIIGDPNAPYDIAALEALGPADAFDFAFIDGWHTFEGVSKDTAAAMALMWSGTIVWDDASAAGVPEFLRTFSWPVTRIEGTRLAFSKVQ